MDYLPVDILSFFFSFPDLSPLSTTCKKMHKISKKSYHELLVSHYKPIIKNNIPTISKNIYILLYSIYQNKFDITLTKIKQLQTNTIMYNQIELLDILTNTLPKLMSYMDNCETLLDYVLNQGWFYIANFLIKMITIHRKKVVFMAVKKYYEFKTNYYATEFMETLISIKRYHEVIVLHSIYNQDELYKRVIDGNYYVGLTFAIEICNYDAINYLLTAYRRDVPTYTLLTHNIYKDMKVYKMLMNNITVRDDQFTLQVNNFINNHVRKMSNYKIADIDKESIMKIPIPFHYLSKYIIEPEPIQEIDYDSSTPADVAGAALHQQ